MSSRPVGLGAKVDVLKATDARVDQESDLRLVQLQGSQEEVPPRRPVLI